MSRTASFFGFSEENERVLRIAKIFMIVIPFVLAVILCLPISSFATDVGGIIDTDTTWDSAGSPYNITATVQVAEYVTLMIEPGV